MGGRVLGTDAGKWAKVMAGDYGFPSGHFNFISEIRSPILQQNVKKIGKE